MMARIIVRAGEPEDATAIADVAVAAFKTLATSQHTEPFTATPERRRSRSLASVPSRRRAPLRGTPRGLPGDRCS